MENEMMRWGVGFGGLWMALLPTGLIVLVVWLVRLMFPQNLEEPEPLELAQHRYAEGAISREEFESLKRDLT